MPKGKKSPDVKSGSRPKRRDKKELKGIIEGSFETGDEGYEWMFFEDDKKGRDGWHVLKEGDHLEIFSEGGLRIFSATIKPDYKFGRQRIPGTNRWQPLALGEYWVYWTQFNFLPDQWAKFFFNKPPLRAILRKK